MARSLHTNREGNTRASNSCVHLQRVPCTAQQLRVATPRSIAGRIRFVAWRSTLAGLLRARERRGAELSKGDSMKLLLAPIIAIAVGLLAVALAARAASSGSAEGHRRWRATSRSRHDSLRRLRSSAVEKDRDTRAYFRLKQEALRSASPAGLRVR
jgi:hypothetical protein